MHDCGLNTWKILLASKKANAMKICKYLNKKSIRRLGRIHLLDCSLILWCPNYVVAFLWLATNILF